MFVQLSPFIYVLNRSDTVQANKHLDNKETSWRNDHQSFFASRGLRWGVEPPVRVRSSPWYGVLCPRAKDVLTFASKTFIESLSTEDPICAVDLSQSLGKHRVFHKGTLGTVTPQQIVWLFQVGGKDYMRLLIGHEALNVQAIPWTNNALSTYQSEVLHSDLGGNAFAGTCSCAAFLAGMRAVTFIPQVVIDLTRDEAEAEAVAEEEFDAAAWEEFQAMSLLLSSMRTEQPLLPGVRRPQDQAFV